MDWKLTNICLESHWLNETESGKMAVLAAWEAFADCGPEAYERAVRGTYPFSIYSSTDQITIAAAGLALTWRPVDGKG